MPSYTFFASSETELSAPANPTWAAARAGGGATTISISRALSFNNAGYQADLNGVVFATSTIPANEIVTAATLSLWPVSSGGSPTIQVRQWAVADGASWVTGATYAARTLLASYALGAWATTGYVQIPGSGTNLVNFVNTTGKADVGIGTRLLLAESAFSAAPDPPAGGSTDARWRGLLVEGTNVAKLDVTTVIAPSMLVMF